MERGVPFVSRQAPGVVVLRGVYHFFYTWWGAIVDGAGDHCVSVRPSSTSRIAYRTFSVHVEMLVEDPGLHFFFFASLGRPSVCVYVSACTSMRLRFRSSRIPRR